MHTLTLIARLAAATLLLDAAGAQAAPLYHLTDLGSQSTGTQINRDGEIAGTFQHRPALYRAGAWVFLHGNSKTTVAGVNSVGAAVGTRGLGSTGHGVPTAVTWNAAGQMKDVIPDAVTSFGTVIRTDGTVYGTAQPAVGGTFPFSWVNGVVTALPAVPGYNWTTPTGVNKSRQIAGTAQFDPRQSICPSAPVLYTGGAWTQLGSLGGDCGAARAINDSGTVVGFSTVDAGDAGHAFSWKNGVMTDIGSLGGGYADAYDINVDGTIVGYSADAALDPHAFVYRNGVMTALDTVVDQLPDGEMIEADSINDVGQIIVSGVGNDLQLHVYRLDPI